MASTTPSSRPLRVVVLGGGPCGLYAARRLVEAPGVEVTLIEKESVPGGLATSHKFGENFFDMGVHMLHEFDEEIYKDVVAMMGAESFPVPLNAKIRWAGSFYRYPLQFADMIKGIPPWTLFKCIAGLLIAQAQQKLAPRVPKNAEEALPAALRGHALPIFLQGFYPAVLGISDDRTERDVHHLEDAAAHGGGHDQEDPGEARDQGFGQGGRQCPARGDTPLCQDRRRSDAAASRALHHREGRARAPRKRAHSAGTKRWARHGCALPARPHPA